MTSFRRPRPSEQDYLVRVCVRLAQPESIVDSSDSAVGYFRVFGIRCVPGEVANVVADAVPDGDVVWDDSEWETVDIDEFASTLEPGVRSHIQPHAQACVWYKSGRALFKSWDAA